MSALLEIADAHVDFGGVHALDGATISIDHRGLYGLIGPNGSGKSTLLGAISRLTDLTSGRLLIEGNDYTQVRRHVANALGIARTFQTVRLLPTMTVLSNVMLGAENEAVRRHPVINWLRIGRARSDSQRARTGAVAALERVGMTAVTNSYPQDLPYGSQRKVEIARALACDPKVLLLDEPTAGMSHSERDEVGTLLMDLNQGGLTQILVEHDLAMIHRVTTHAFALNFGKVIAGGTPAQVAADPLVREAYLGHGASAPPVGSDPGVTANPHQSQ